VILNLLERHRDKWVEDGECYRWIGAASPRPTIGIGGNKTALVSRLMCEEAHGPHPPFKPLAIHDTPNGCIGDLCVNGEHLRWGDKRDNSFDIPAEQRAAIARHARDSRIDLNNHRDKPRNLARLAGEKTYISGKPCKNGHTGPRHTASGDCIACRVEWNRSRVR
jgi:hypothetical protein